MYTRVPPPAAVDDWTERSDSERPPPPPPVKSFAAFHLDVPESHLRTCPFVGATDRSTSDRLSRIESSFNNFFHAVLCE